MRRRRGEWLLLSMLPCLVLAQSGYDAQPIGRFSAEDNVGHFQPPSPPRPVPRGYQPPPSPLMFQAPRSRFNSAEPPQNIYAIPNYRKPPTPVMAPQSVVRYVGSRQNVRVVGNENKQSAPPALAPPVGFVEGWSDQQIKPPALPVPQPSNPSRLIYTPQVTAHRDRGPPAARPQEQRQVQVKVQPAVSSTEENPPDVLNNIIVHIYLNAKGKQSHTVATSGPIKGLFGIGTSHGGPGTHTNPIVIKKEFDRDTLEFVEEENAKLRMRDGPSNIVEVQAMVSTPDRKIENTLNKAVNTELNRAIPMVMNRMRGPMQNLDDELRKELEQALVDELAKNLGETIDNMGPSPSDEDLGALIEEGFNEINKDLTSSTTTTTQRSTTTKQTTTRRTTRPVAIITAPSPDREIPPPPAPETTSRTQPPRTSRITTTKAPSTTTVSPTPTVPWWWTMWTKTTTPRTTNKVPTTTEAPTTITVRWWRNTTTEAPATTTMPWWRTHRVSTTKPSTPSTIAAEVTTSTTRPSTTARTRSTTTSRRTTATSTSRGTTESPTRATTTEAASPSTTTIPWWRTHRITSTTPGTSSTTEKVTTSTHRVPTTTTKVFMTTSTVPNRWKTTEVALKVPGVKSPPEFNEDETPETTEKATPAWPVPSIDEESEKDQERIAPFRPTRPSHPKWTGQVAPARKSEEEQEEEEPKFVTSRPIHIVSLDESAETVTTTTQRGTTMGRRVTSKPSPPPASGEATQTPIFDESAFEKGTTTTRKTVPPTLLTAEPEPTVTVPTPAFTESPPTVTTTRLFRIQNRTSTTSSTTVTFGTLPTETEEPEEEEEHVVVKGRPTNFGDQNMMKADIEKVMLEETFTEDMVVVTTSSATTAELPTLLPRLPEDFESTAVSPPVPSVAPTEIEPLSMETSEVDVTSSATTTEVPTLPARLPEDFESTAVSPAELPIIPTRTEPSSMKTTETEVFPEEVISTTTEAPPFEFSPGVLEPDVMHRQPSVPETTTQMEITSSVQLPSVEVQPIPGSIAMPKGSCPTPNDHSDKNRTDVLFLLDSSNSYNEQKFMHAIQLLMDTVKHFRNIGPNGTQISLVQYNTEPYLEFSLRKHNCRQWLIDDIADTDYMQGGSMLGKAVEKVSRFAFTKNRGDRPDAENVLVVLTDGQSDDKIQEPVEIAKKNNVTVLVIATVEANPNYIMELAGNMDNVFRFHTDPHKRLSQKLAERIMSLSSAATLSVAPATATQPTPTTTMRILGPHEMFTISMPKLDSNAVAQETVDEGLQTGTGHHLPPSSPIVPTVSTLPWRGNEPEGFVHLECSHLGFKIKFNLPGDFSGVAQVKGQEDREECRKEIRPTEGSSNSSTELFVATKTCGVTRVKSIEPPGQNYSLILLLAHHGSLVTERDRAYLLQCFIGKPTVDAELSADLTVMKGELMIAETITLTSVPPTCSYSIRKDSPDGPTVKTAIVGETVYHRWDCDGGEEANHVYGIQIHSCYASDDIDMKFPIVDKKGCSSDLALLSDPKYMDDRLSAYAESKAFAFQKAESLKFVCKLSLCTRDGDGCEGVTPPTCGGSSPDLLITRRLRHQNVLEGALSSALSTKVDVTSERPPLSRVVDVLSSKGSLILLAVLVVAAILGSVLLARYVRHPVDATTICSDPETLMSSPTSPIPPSETANTLPRPTSFVESSHAEANQRLAEFMRSFDRSRYV
ncbi:unnamed protein product [Cylicocyclus nassatus]|uniref:Uncharacterized protein n=1 Tax=Cylicocyclus nassatus TaxID=53992 RepID=A0AA36GWD6_CYLNA|nr:unnamed protein product [Cylicocyclus nassatus]